MSASLRKRLKALRNSESDKRLFQSVDLTSGLSLCDLDRPRFLKSVSSSGLSSVSDKDAEGFDEAVENTSPFHHCISHALSLHLTSLLKDFRSNGLPWQGDQCRSLMAGGSGCLYALPALYSCSRSEQALWITQSILSVCADYFNVHHDSVAHGIDRIFATFVLVNTCFRGSSILQWWTPIWAVLPCSFFVAASGAKKDLNLELWHWYHFFWHLTGSFVCMMMVYLIYNCPDADGLFSFMCRP